MPVKPLAPDAVTVWESTDPETQYSCSPGVCRLENGRLVCLGRE